MRIELQTKQVHVITDSLSPTTPDTVEANPKRAKARCEWLHNLCALAARLSLSPYMAGRSLRGFIQIHIGDYSLAQHYHCWLAGDCSQGQDFCLASPLSSWDILQAWWAADAVAPRGVKWLQTSGIVQWPNSGCAFPPFTLNPFWIIHPTVSVFKPYFNV